jgi:hypothetical protein
MGRGELTEPGKYRSAVGDYASTASGRAVARGHL